MTPQEAEKIVKAFCASVEVNDGRLAMRASLLPCSKARIRYAYFVWLETLTKEHLLTEEIRVAFTRTYPILDHVLEDKQAIEINAISEMSSQKEISRDNPEHKVHFDKLSDFILRSYTESSFIEILDYVDECLARYSAH